MSSGDNYYVGHPVTYTAPAPGTKQAPQQVTAGGDQQIPVSTQTPAGATHNDKYFVGHPVNPEKTPQAQPAAAASPPPVHNKRSSFLAICFPCIGGGGSRVAEQ